MNATTNKTIYLVTGAAGFLGGTICRQLVERGEKVRAFVLPNDKAIKFIPSEVEIVEGDLCDIHSLEKLFTVPEGYETIVMHIASIVTVNPDYNQKVMDVNVGGTQNIIDLCLLHKECKKLVYCSSTGWNVGIIGMLIFGTGMCCCLLWNMYVLGVVLGILGIQTMALAYPTRNRLVGKKRRELTKDIQALSNELLGENC